MLRGLRTPVSGDGIDHDRQRLRCRNVTVQQPERLPVVDADTHFELHPVERPARSECGGVDIEFGDVAHRRLVDDPTHLQSAHFTEHHGMFDVRRRSRLVDHRDEFQVFGRRW